MSRSGYSADWEPYDTADWLRSCAYTANTERHMKGRMGQAFLWELYQALTDLPSRELVLDTMQDEHGGVCALGAVAVRRGTPFPETLRTTEDVGEDWYFADNIAAHLGIKGMMAREVMEANDERHETDHERWTRMRRWVVQELKDIP